MPIGTGAVFVPACIYQAPNHSLPASFHNDQDIIVLSTDSEYVVDTPPSIRTLPLPSSYFQKVP